MRSLTFDEIFKLLSVMGALGTFLWSVYVWKEDQQQQREAAQRAARTTSETRRIEATQPFLDRQLKLYTETTQIAAVLSASDDANERAKAGRRFWELYWGELAMVEDRGVETAMVAFGRALESGAPKERLGPLSLQLAGACRLSLDRAWGIGAWTQQYRDHPKTD